jgi:hypothetical protein
MKKKNGAEMCLKTMIVIFGTREERTTRSDDDAVLTLGRQPVRGVFGRARGVRLARLSCAIVVSARRRLADDVADATTFLRRRPPPSKRFALS